MRRSLVLVAVVLLSVLGCKKKSAPCFDTKQPREVRYASCVEQCERNKAACDLADDLRAQTKEPASAPATAAAPAKDAGPVDVKRLAAAAQKSIGASDAARLRQLTHPTGKGGALGDVKVTTSEYEVQVDIPVSWQGGFTSTPYETVYRWTLDDRGASRLTIASDTAVVEIDEAHRAAAENFLKTKRAGLVL